MSEIESIGEKDASLTTEHFLNNNDSYQEYETARSTIEVYQSLSKFRSFSERLWFPMKTALKLRQNFIRTLLENNKQNLVSTVMIVLKKFQSNITFIIVGWVNHYQHYLYLFPFRNVAILICANSVLMSVIMNTRRQCTENTVSSHHVVYLMSCKIFQNNLKDHFLAALLLQLSGWLIHCFIKCRVFGTIILRVNWNFEVFNVNCSMSSLTLKSTILCIYG